MSSSTTDTAEARSNSSASKNGRNPRGISMKGMRALVVEDNKVNRKVVEALLKRQGLKVEVAVNGIEALAMSERGDYAFILMDCHMPEMDGFEATRRIRTREAEEGRPRMPIIALTASVLKKNRKACAEAGMDEFLAKPIKKGDLEDLLESVLDLSFHDD